jgi:hypothetical protein
MSTNIDCYLQFKKEKEDSYATCGIVLVHEKDEIYTDFVSYDNGLYLEGMLRELLKGMEHVHNNVIGGVNLHVKVNGRNAIFNKTLKKAERAYHLIKNVKNEMSINFILKQFLTNKDYHKPKSYDSMVAIAKALVVVNDRQPFAIIQSNDSYSYNSQRTYMEVCGRHAKHGGKWDVSVPQIEKNNLLELGCQTGASNLGNVGNEVNPENLGNLDNEGKYQF